MWIRSQSRKALLNVNQVVIIPSVDKRMYFICNSLEKESVTLGVYLTEEKALKVLDRIEELIENQCGLTFYMPADDEAGHGCTEKVKEWLKSPYKKPTYKLSQFEYDLINAFDRCKECCLLNEIECLKKLIEKGYFKGIDPFTKVHDIIDNCEVIK